jgi:hypothetical protein
MLLVSKRNGYFVTVNQIKRAGEYQCRIVWKQADSLFHRPEADASHSILPSLLDPSIGVF